MRVVSTTPAQGIRHPKGPLAVMKLLSVAFLVSLTIGQQRIVELPGRTQHGQGSESQGRPIDFGSIDSRNWPSSHQTRKQ